MADPLVPLAAAPGPLELVKASWRKGLHELRADAGTVGRLDYSVWSGKARAQAADGAWAFGRSKGILRRSIAVTEGKGGRRIAEFDQNTWTRGGTVELDGVQYVLGAGGFLRPEWTWSRDGRTLVAVRKRFALGSGKGAVELTDAGRADEHASLLLLLAVHVILTEDADSGSGAAAAAG